MSRNFILTALILIIAFTGCKPSRDKSVAEIQKMETSMYEQQGFSFNKQKADSLMMKFDEFITRFPSDSLAPVYLFKAANLAIALGDGNKALTLLDQFISGYPDHPKTPVCAFFKGYVYENILKDLVKARESYMAYIQKYPNDVFVKDARMAIMNLGKTSDEIVREFEEQQRRDSIRKADSVAALKPGKKRN